MIGDFFNTTTNASIATTFLRHGAAASISPTPTFSPILTALISASANCSLNATMPGCTDSSNSFNQALLGLLALAFIFVGVFACAKSGGSSNSQACCVASMATDYVALNN